MNFSPESSYIVWSFWSEAHDQTHFSTNPQLTSNSFPAASDSTEGSVLLTTSIRPKKDCANWREEGLKKTTTTFLFSTC